MTKRPYFWKQSAHRKRAVYALWILYCIVITKSYVKIIEGFDAVFVLSLDFLSDGMDAFVIGRGQILSFSFGNKRKHFTKNTSLIYMNNKLSLPLILRCRPVVMIRASANTDTLKMSILLLSYSFDSINQPLLLEIGMCCTAADTSTETLCKIHTPFLLSEKLLFKGVRIVTDVKFPKLPTLIRVAILTLSIRIWQVLFCTNCSGDKWIETYTAAYLIW